MKFIKLHTIKGKVVWYRADNILYVIEEIDPNGDKATVIYTISGEPRNFHFPVLETPDEVAKQLNE